VLPCFCMRMAVSGLGGAEKHNHHDNSITIRPARAEDAGRIAELSGQLGYPAAEEDIRRRLAAIEQDGRGVVYVAEADGQAIGWVHVYSAPQLESDPHAEIGGLVVDEAHRGCGVGRLLMQEAEDWAREHGCREVRVRSNVIREQAHIFYERIDYINVKTQKVFRKILR